MKYHYDILQGSDEWLNIRKGKITASVSHTLMLVTDKLNKGSKSIAHKLNCPFDDDFKGNKWTERGHELEPFAREEYELNNWIIVNEVGFVEYNNYIGCSPDGLIGDDGGLEIKCLSVIQHSYAINGIYDKSYESQCHFNMLCTNRMWWDLVFYHPDFDTKLKVYRIKRDKEKDIQFLKAAKIVYNYSKQLEK